MKHLPTLPDSKTPPGYVSSGRLSADIKRDEAIAERDLARRCFRAGMFMDGSAHMRRAIRAWRNYRRLLERIVG